MSLPKLNPLIELICKEKGVQREIVIHGLEKAFATVAKKRTSLIADIKAEYTPEDDTIKIMRYKVVVEKVHHVETEMSIEEAKTLDPEVELGDSLGVELSTSIFTRNDIITISQIVKNGNLTAQKEVILNEFSGRKYELVSGIIKQIDNRGNVYVGLGKTDGVIPWNQIMKTDELRVNTKIEAIITEIGQKHALGDIVLSRTHHMLAYRMLEAECPEISDGTIQIEAIAREPGIRTKVIVSSETERDPVKVVVGNNGFHIQNLVEKMSGEKINIIGKGSVEHMLEQAVSPGKYTKATITDDGITLVVEEENLGKIVGKKGANIRLAASVLNKKISIISDVKLREKTVQARKEFDDLELLTLVESEALLAQKVLGLSALSKMPVATLASVLSGDEAKANQVLDKAKQMVQDLKLVDVDLVESYGSPVEFEIPSKKSQLSEKVRQGMLRQEIKNSLNMK